MHLIEYQANRYSQTGEDGIIAEIFRRLGVAEGWFVEFGACDGKWLSNTYNLLAHKNWQGVYIEAHAGRYEQLLKTQAQFPGKIHTLCATVGFEGENKLGDLLARTPLPKNFELLSIDIDSYDWQVWRALEHYQPQVVIIELNCTIPPGIVSTHNPPASQGASFTALVNLGREKGYQLVCQTGNCFFVRNDLVPKLGLPQALLAAPEKMFNRSRHRKERLLQLARTILPAALMSKLFRWADFRRMARQSRQSPAGGPADAR